MSLMPVAKKTTNSNKKQKVSLIQKLKLNTLKGRMIATALVFAIVGGGFMVYRSFAATINFTYNANAGTLTVHQGGLNPASCPNTVVKDDVNGKAGTNVLKVSCPYGSEVTINGFKEYLDSTFINKILNICVEARTDSNFVSAPGYNPNVNAYAPVTGDSARLVFIPKTTYGNYCSNNIVVRRAGDFQAKVSFMNMFDKGNLGNLYISNITVKEVVSSTPTPTAPK